MASSTVGAFWADLGSAATFASTSWARAVTTARSAACRRACSWRALWPNKSASGISHTASSSAAAAIVAHHPVTGHRVGNCLYSDTLSAVRSASSTAAAANGSTLPTVDRRAYRAVLNFSASPSRWSIATAAWWADGRRSTAYTAAATTAAPNADITHTPGRGKCSWNRWSTATPTTTSPQATAAAIPSAVRNWPTASLFCTRAT